MASDLRVPKRIGRYEIVGRLAAGGMAEVFLGRLAGPHGFERPVVVKRILPHLALDATVVSMFLDEARIIANLRHPNLIHVHELGRDGEDLFIAMEFLEGETLAGLCRRLASRGELLDFSLAAYIVAEACAGLHAAHEAQGLDGRALEIVHRDVSPQNVFVTYSGNVHVIDFGIATTVDRISRTQAGTVRGKFEYLAPEQLQALPVDRRADVFALGVVLLELASGRRVFKRAHPGATVAAITTEQTPRLGDLRPGAPTGLEEICLQAMARSRRERFQTAADMRRALLAFTRTAGLDDDPREVVAQRMRELFADRIAEKVAMLQSVRHGSFMDALPVAEADLEVELPSMQQARTELTTLSRSLVVRTDAGPPRRRWGSIAGVVSGLLVVLLLTGWRWTLTRHGSEIPAGQGLAASRAMPAASTGWDAAGAVPDERPAPPATTPDSTPTTSALPSQPAASETPVVRRRPPSRATAALPAEPRPSSAPTPAPTIW